MNKATMPLITLLLVTTTGCQMYTPGGNPFFNGPESAATYQSTAEVPKTVILLDTRSGEQLFVERNIVTLWLQIHSGDNGFGSKL